MRRCWVYYILPRPSETRDVSKLTHDQLKFLRCSITDSELMRKNRMHFVDKISEIIHRDKVER